MKNPVTLTLPRDSCILLADHAVLVARHMRESADSGTGVVAPAELRRWANEWEQVAATLRAAGAQ